MTPPIVSFVPVQPMSIQNLSMSRTHAYIKDHEAYKEKLGLLSIIRLIVEIYNAQKENQFARTKASAPLGEFHIVWYGKTVEGETKLTQVATSPEAEESRKTSSHTYIGFLFRESPRREIFAVTSRDAWHVVRECINYKFPLRVSERIVDPHKISRITRRSLVGSSSEKEELTNPSEDLLFSLNSLYYLIESYDALINPNSSVYGLACFKRCKHLKIRVETGVIRLLEKISPEAYADLLVLLSEILRGETTRTIGETPQNEEPHPLLGYFRLLSPIYSRTLYESLDQMLVETIRLGCVKNQDLAVHLRHKYLGDYLYADSYGLKFPGKQFKPLPKRPPTLLEVVGLMRNNDSHVLDNEATFRNAFTESRLRYQHGDSPEVNEPLISYLEGEVRDSAGNAFFKIRGMWCRLDADYHALMEQMFKGLLQKTLLASGHEGELPLEWVVEADGVETRKITQALLKKDLKMAKGNGTLCKNLKDNKVCYIKDVLVVQPLTKEILQIKVIFKNKKKIEDYILKTKKVPPKDKLTKLFGKDADAVLAELRKKQIIVQETRVMHSRLKGEILKVKVIMENRAKIEDSVLKAKKVPSKKDLEEVFGKDTDAILKELKTPRTIVGGKGEVETPLFSFPVETRYKDPLQKLLDDAYEAKEKAAKVQKGRVKREELYNRQYLNRPEFLVFDQICPSNIEPFDVMRYTDTTTYLYHVKEKFGQSTRDVCSQILNAAIQFRSALSMQQTANYIQGLWQKGTTASADDAEGYRAIVKKQLTEMGEKEFYKLFYNRRLVFVYACVEERLAAESRLPSRITPEDLEKCASSDAEKKKLYEALQKAKYVDKYGRLTNLLYDVTKDTFKLEGYDKKALEKILTTLKTFKSSMHSTLAKLELLQLAQKMQSLGFDLAITSIKRGKSDQQGDSQVPPTQPSQGKQGAEKKEKAEKASSEEEAEAEDEGEPNPYQGLKNVGNTCYMNAALQACFNIPEILHQITVLTQAEDSEYLSKLVAAKEKRTEDALRELRQSMFDHTNRFYTVSDDEAETEKSKKRQLTRQQDSHECLTFILEQLQLPVIDAVIRMKADEITSSGKEYYDRCPLAENRDRHLSIPIEEDVKTFQEVIDGYFNEQPQEDLEQPARITLSEGEAELKLSQWSEAAVINAAPSLLIVHLKRFKYSQQMDEEGVAKDLVEKIETALEYPADGIITLPTEQGKKRYALQGFINHIGNSPKSGHYTADFRNPAGQWVFYDDSKPPQVGDLREEIAEQSYIVFLREVQEGAEKKEKEAKEEKEE